MSETPPPPPPGAPGADASYDDAGPDADDSGARRRWRLRFGDQVFGPYDISELETLVQEGRLDRASLLAPEGGGEDWRPAGEIAGLAGLFASAALPQKAKPPRLQTASGPDPLMLHLVYGLYTASFLIAVTALVGIIVAYVKRGEAVGTWQASHYEWQIRTFWWGLGFFVLGFLTMFILIGFAIWLGGAIWVIYRIIKGWLRLSQLRAIEEPTGFL